MNPIGKAVLAGCQILAQERPGEYVCFPITTGKRLWDLAAKRGIQDLNTVKTGLAKECRYDHYVIRSNLKEGRAFVAAVERQHPLRPVYDPSRLWVPEWNQFDYYRFWKVLIRRSIARIHLCDGWQYSQGCVVECVFAFRLGLRVHSASGKPISAKACRRLLEEAWEKGHAHGFDVRFLKRAVGDLSRL